MSERLSSCVYWGVFGRGRRGALLIVTVSCAVVVALGALSAPAQEPPKNGEQPAQPDYYLWYNCTLAMFQVGGTPWERWNAVVRDRIIGLQERQGCARGSWAPNSRWGNVGGRVYTTALAVLTLEVYYRFASQRAAAD